MSADSLSSGLTLFLTGFAVIAALYGGWMWLRAPDELTGRPYWIIGLAALSIISALSGNHWARSHGLRPHSRRRRALPRIGPAAWTNRALLIGAWSLSSLPFSLTASAWLGKLGLFIPLVIAAQALIIAGFIRHALRPSGRDTLESQPRWARAVYPAGIFLLLAIQLVLGLFGWDGALQIGAWCRPSSFHF